MPQQVIYIEGDELIAVTVPEWADPEAIAATNVPTGRPYRIVESADVPEDLFRRSTGLDLVVDMTKARNVWRDVIRKERARGFAKLDGEYVRALQLNDNAAKGQVTAKAQALRDAPADPRIDAATTLAELRAVWPDALSEV